MDLVFNPKPTFPQQSRDTMSRSKDFQPVVRTPTGYFSQDEEAARRFDKQYKEDKRTPSFLFKEFMIRYYDGKNPEDLAKAKEFARQIPRDSREAIIRSVRKDIALMRMSPEKRAMYRMGKKERGAYRRGISEDEQ
jgi:hypothetical protein